VQNKNISCKHLREAIIFTVEFKKSNFANRAKTQIKLSIAPMSVTSPENDTGEFAKYRNELAIVTLHMHINNDVHSCSTQRGQTASNVPCKTADTFHSRSLFNESANRPFGIRF